MKSLKVWSLILVGLMASGLLVSATAFAMAGQDEPPPDTVIVSDLVVPKLSPVMRDVTYLPPVRVLDREEINPIKNPGLFLPDFGLSGTDTKAQDPLVAVGLSPMAAPSPDLNFEGQGDFNMYAPPDTTGDVGPDHFVQMVNVETAVYDKSGNLIDHWANNQLWAGFGGPCESDNSGDPIVLYDDINDRWLLSQFAVSSGQHMCIAISTTSDPTGSYHLYAFPMPDFPDYPKLGVWPDGYYLGTNSGAPYQYYAHVFEREAMLVGNPATMLSVGGQANFLMPADADGVIAPPNDAPGTFYTFFDGGYPNHPAGVDRLALFEFDADWDTPTNSTFTLVQEIPIAEFNYTTCGFFNRDCLPQLGTTRLLDAVDPWPMVRLQYRNFGPYEGMVGNFTVDVDGSDHAGIRWFELRRQGASTWDLQQEGTYAPDGHNRFMGSIAMDGSGNIALGYSITSASMYPSIRYTVHAQSDTPGTMQAEAELMAGSGSQTSTQRWGDYSATIVDPNDNCTFWITNMYHDQMDTGFSWNTRIGTFRIPSCTGSLGDTGTMAGVVTDSGTSDPIANANVEATLSITQTFSRHTDVTGSYTFNGLSLGTYTVTASAFGYLPATINGAEVFSGTTTIVDIALDAAPSYLVGGTITDANTGWPLYASIDIDGYPGDLVWNDPVTGYYEVSLPGGFAYTFNVNAWVPGYLPASVNVGPLTSDTTQNFALVVDTANCVAPGYTGPTCSTPSGGLVVGNVYDQNTSEALNGSMVENEAGYMTEAVETPFDSNVDDGFYTIFSPAGLQTFTATMNGGYQPDVETITVVSNDTISESFYLDAGMLNAIPTDLSVSLDMGDSVTRTLELSNTGAADVYFEIAELDNGFVSALRPIYQAPTVASAAGQSLSQFGSANLQGIRRAYAPGDTILNQPPNISNGIFSDGDCSLCTTGQQSAAENFTLANEVPISQIVFWTGYYPGNIPQEPDAITVIFHEDSSGLPGTAVYTESDVAYERIQTGITLFGVDEWMHTLTLEQPVTLAAGNYWIEIYNFTTGNSDQFFWETGDIDPVSGLTGSAWATATPGVSWNYDNTTELAIQLVEGNATNVPWLSEDPISGTVATIDNQVIDVTFDAGVPEVVQPGDYLAELRITNDTPYGNLLVPVTMTVIAPPTYGKLEGTVNGLGHCDNDPAALEDAQVVIVGASKTITLTTDMMGYYSYWLDESEAPLTISVTADGHINGNVSGVSMIGGETTTQDFDLRSLEPCINLDSDRLEVTLIEGYSTTIPIEINNDGALLSDFEILERSMPPTASTYIASTARNDTAEVAPRSLQFISPLAIGDSLFQVDAGTSTGSGLLLGVEFADDYYYVTAGGLSGTAEQNYLFQLDTDGNLITTWTQPTTSEWGWRDLAYDGQYLYASDSDVVEQIDPATGTATGVTIACPTNPCRALAYDPDSDHFWTANFSSNIWEFDRSGVVLNTFSNSLAIYGAAWDKYSDGGPYLWVWSQDGTPEATATQIDPASGTPTGIAFVGIDIGTGANMAGGATIIEGDHPNHDGMAVFAGLHQADSDTIVGYDLDAVVVTDLPWLSEDPITGTIAADDALNIDVTFDTMTYTAGIHEGMLKIKNDDPTHPFINIPVTMTIEAPTYGAELIPTADSQTGVAEETVTYTLQLNNTGNMPNTFTINESGSNWTVDISNNSIALNPGESASFTVSVVIPADAVDGDSDVATITATGANNATASAELTTEVISGVELSPAMDSLTGAPGEIVTYILQITNTGNTPNTFTVSESSASWTVSISDESISLNPTESTDFTVSVTIPATAVDGESDTANITVTGTNDATASSELTTGAVIAPTYSVGMTPLTATLSGAPGETVSYTLHLINTGNVFNTFAIAGSGANWNVSLPLDPIMLGAGEDTYFVVTVTIPDSAVGGDSDTVTITASGSGDATATSTLTTEVVLSDYQIFLPLIMR